MSNFLTGYLERPSFGLALYMHDFDEDVTDVLLHDPNAQRLTKDLAIVDVDRYEPNLPGLIGTVSLHAGSWGSYDALYEFTGAGEKRWGGHGIMTTAVRTVLDRLVIIDPEARSVQFDIPHDNTKSVHLAEHLGAAYDPSHEQYVLPLDTIRAEASGE